MKNFANLWWVFLIATIITYCIYSDCLNDIQTLVDQNTGWTGFFTGFFHGLAGDSDYASRVGNEADSLVARANFWQDVYRMGFLITVISGGAKLYFANQRKTRA